VFPGLGVVISVYGLAVNPVSVERHLHFVAGLLPASVVQLVSVDLHRFLDFQRNHLGLSLTLSVLFTLTAGRAAMGALMGALNTIYGRIDNRRFVYRHGVGLALVVAALVFVAITFAMIALTPILVYHIVPMGWAWRHAVDFIRWPILAAMMMSALSRIYRVAPHRERPARRHFPWGAGIATALWLAFSLIYSYYLGEVASTSVIYGSVSSAVALSIWLYLSSLAVLIGAEIDTLLSSGAGTGRAAAHRDAMAP
jgi:membrane protein